MNTWKSRSNFSPTFSLISKHSTMPNRLICYHDKCREYHARFLSPRKNNSDMWLGNLLIRRMAEGWGLVLHAEVSDKTKLFKSLQIARVTEIRCKKPRLKVSTHYWTPVLCHCSQYSVHSFTESRFLQPWHDPAEILDRLVLWGGDSLVPRMVFGSITDLYSLDARRTFP